jgi:nucleoside-diphosphate-sugar epimerase
LSISNTSEGLDGRRTIAVTGGAGFIGSHVTDALIARGERVRVIDSLSTGLHQNINPAAEFVKADVCDLQGLSAALRGVDCVLHNAALARVPLSIEQPVRTHMVNVVGTLNVLLAARDLGVRRVVYAGSSSVYGNQAELPLRETMCPNPLNPYALQKLTGEEYTRMFHRLFGLQTLTLRYFNVFGPRMATDGAYVTVLAVFLRARREQHPLTIHGDGEQTRDFTHVADVARANVLAVDCEIADGRALNIGQGSSLSINQIAALIGGPTAKLAPRPGDSRNTLADWSEARRVLGWSPEVTTRQGIAQLLRDAGF